MNHALIARNKHLKCRIIALLALQNPLPLFIQFSHAALYLNSMTSGGDKSFEKSAGKFAGLNAERHPKSWRPRCGCWPHCERALPATRQETGGGSATR